MPTIHPASFTARGWQESDSGMPKDLFFADSGADFRITKPHLHVNYNIGGALASVTYKNVMGQNTYLFKNGAWDSSAVMMLHFSPLKPEVAFIRALA
jgi:hypothetical protein